VEVTEGQPEQVRMISNCPQDLCPSSQRESSMICNIVDVELVRAHEIIQQLRTEFVPAARISMLAELAAMIAFEVNQPLAAIRIDIESGLRYLNGPDLNVAQARKAMQRSASDARRATDVISSFRAMAAGKPPQRAILSLENIVEESLVFLHSQLQSTAVFVCLDLEPSLPTLTGDRTQLQQVIVNLAINAVEAMAQSTPAERKLLIRAKLSGPWISCSHEDSGPGIDQHHLDQLFRGFFTTKDVGMGMGLPVCRSIIEAHGGELQADNNSVLGGARFSFLLPLGVSSSE
jgi:C4-dicarboxylate-specific signal transduction histidine kinase